MGNRTYTYSSQHTCIHHTTRAHQHIHTPIKIDYDGVHTVCHHSSASHHRLALAFAESEQREFVASYHKKSFLRRSHLGRLRLGEDQTCFISYIEKKRHSLVGEVSVGHKCHDHILLFICTLASENFGERASQRLQYGRGNTWASECGTSDGIGWGYGIPPYEYGWIMTRHCSIGSMERATWLVGWVQ